MAEAPDVGVPLADLPAADGSKGRFYGVANGANYNFLATEEHHFYSGGTLYELTTSDKIYIDNGTYKAASMSVSMPGHNDQYLLRVYTPQGQRTDYVVKDPGGTAQPRAVITTNKGEQAVLDCGEAALQAYGKKHPLNATPFEVVVAAAAPPPPAGAAVAPPPPPAGAAVAPPPPPAGAAVAPPPPPAEAAAAPPPPPAAAAAAPPPPAAKNMPRSSARTVLHKDDITNLRHALERAKPHGSRAEIKVLQEHVGAHDDGRIGPETTHDVEGWFAKHGDPKFAKRLASSERRNPHHCHRQELTLVEDEVHVSAKKHNPKAKIDRKPRRDFEH